MSDFSFVADTKIGDAWTNQSLSKFAIVPDAPDQDLDVTSSLVDSLARSYLDAPDTRGGSAIKNEVLAELYDLNARGLVLWPLGVQWKQAAMGEVTGYRFLHLIEEEDPEVLELRDRIQQSSSFQVADYQQEKAQTLAHGFWRLFMTMRMANAGLNDIHFLSEAHLFNLVNAMRVDGVWSDWLSTHGRYEMFRFGRFLASHHDDPMFAVGFLNPARRMKLGPRVPTMIENHRHLAWVFDAFETWMDRTVSMTKKPQNSARRLFSEYLSTLPAERTTPNLAFQRPTMKGLVDFARNWSSPQARALALSRFLEFAEWYCSDYGPNAGESPELGLTRYDVEQFSKAIPPLPSRTADVRARPMPMRFHYMLKEILSENDFAWPKSILNGINGRPQHWISSTNPETGEVTSVFCEVLPRMLLAHLELPLRNIQIRRLDSGEGDEREFVSSSGKWFAGRGPLAGYWKRNGAKNPRRGVIREIATDTGTIAGFWINSNKTQDASNLFDESSGYEIPWQHDEVIENLQAMRRWQEKHNPVTEPLPHAELPEGLFKQEDPSRAVRAVLPARFYLFRYPKNSGRRGREAPPPYTTFRHFFFDALEELERRLRAQDPEAAITIITERDESGQPQGAIFTIHGMRASTLTTLHLAGVPIEVLSKVVAGHATILMTLRYTKFNPAHVNDILNNARAQALSSARIQFANFLKSASIENAMRMTARITDDGIQQMKGSYDEPTCWVRMDTGICPNGATQCHIGGPVIALRKEKDGRDRSTFGPVPGGSRNCVRCRFFVTGLPFLIPLWAHATSILAKVDSVSKRAASLKGESDHLKRQRQASEGGASQSLSDRIRIVDEAWIAETEQREQALADLHATMVLVAKVRTIAGSGDAGDEAKLPMLVGDEGIPEVTARESTRFELVDAVVQASRWFPSMNSAELEVERDEFLNKVLYRNGYVPITLAPLTAQERRKAADALAQMLLVELGAAETQHLIEGRKTLADFGLQDKLERAAAAAIGHPMERLALSKPTSSPPLIEAAAE
jgi:hypothetical protein